MLGLAGANRATIYEMSADGGMHVLQASARLAMYATRCGLREDAAHAGATSAVRSVTHGWPCESTVLSAEGRHWLQSSTLRDGEAEVLLAVCLM